MPCLNLMTQGDKAVRLHKIGFESQFFLKKILETERFNIIF